MIRKQHIALFVFILIKKANTLSDEYLFALFLAIDAAAADTIDLYKKTTQHLTRRIRERENSRELN
jgi:hypothetical protein